jgi:hypothetical protein
MTEDEYLNHKKEELILLKEYINLFSEYPLVTKLLQKRINEIELYLGISFERNKKLNPIVKKR